MNSNNFIKCDASSVCTKVCRIPNMIKIIGLHNAFISLFHETGSIPIVIENFVIFQAVTFCVGGKMLGRLDCGWNMSSR